MAYRIGIDAGSKTIKLVVLDEDGRLVHHIYWRHRSNIRKTLLRMLDEFSSRWGGVEGTVAITGSAGISLAKALGLPFVQEVVATTQAVRERFPDADAVIELGGEDAKVIYLSGGIEQRMNASCAGGTGSFIDTIAFMLGVRTAEMNQLARRANHIYPIASRCAVFAQTDVRPLLNAGARKEDVAASVLEAVVRQTLGGLACGRPIRGKVVFLGGPFEYLPELARRFSAALGLEESAGVRPEKAHLFTARGAALAAGDAAAAPAGAGDLLSISKLAALVADCEFDDDQMPRLPALFADEWERVEFEERHAAQTMPRRSLFSSHGPLYLGFDAGSTTVKYALVNEAGELVGSSYRAAGGDVLETACSMLAELYELLPDDGSCTIAQAVAIGYGDKLLRAALHLDADVVETAAHVRAAQAFRPDVSFVLDIGGQDMKALWVRDGRVVDAVLNEACSSGCGSFVEGTAHAMRLGPSRFSNEALRSRAPLDLGTRCTVFMTSRVRHAQKIGAPVADIAAGIAYSVVQNALYRVIGRDKSDEMGDVVVVQGGTFKSDAVLRAFEKVAGVQAVRPDTAHLMGAIGAALIARDRAHELRQAADPGPVEVTSAIVDAKRLEALDPSYESRRCEGCANACTLSIVRFGDGDAFVSGNRCERGRELVVGEHDGAGGGGASGGDAGGAGQEARAGAGLHGSAGAQITGGAAADAAAAPAGQARRERGAGVRFGGALAYRQQVPDVLGRELKALSKYGACTGRRELGHVRLGIETALNGYELLPFWHTLFSFLGFSIVEPQKGRLEGAIRWQQAFPDDACEPIRRAHGHMEGFTRTGADAVFAPRYRKGLRCHRSEDYLAELCDVLAADELAEGNASLRIVAPVLSSMRPECILGDERDVQAICDAVAEIAHGMAPDRRTVVDALRLAWREQVEFEKQLVHGIEHAQIWVAGDASHCAAVAAYRPCIASRELLGKLGEAFAADDVAVLPALGLEHIVRRRAQGGSASRFDPTDSGMPILQPLHSDAAWSPDERTEQLAEYACDVKGCELLVVEGAHCEYAAQGVRRASPASHDALHLPVEEADDPKTLTELSGQVRERAAEDRKRAAELAVKGVSGPKADDLREAAPIVPYRPTGLLFARDRGVQPQNMVARERALLARFGSVVGTSRSDTSVGLPAALTGYELLPFWHTLFAELGFSVVVAGEADVARARSASAESIPSESVCEPAKLVHAHVYALESLGAGAVFMPVYARGGRCAVQCGYAQVLQGNVPFLADGSVAFASPRLTEVRPERMRQEDLHAIWDSLRGLDAGSAVERAEFDEALAKALSAQERFESELQRQTRQALDVLAADPTARGVVLAGHGYHVDPLLAHGVDELLVELGFSVFSAAGLGVADGAPGCTPAGCAGALRTWEPAGRLLQLAGLAAENPKLDIVVLWSFGCAYDAAVLGDVRDAVTGAGRPFTALKVDEIVDTAHVRIRLRTMAESIAAMGTGAQAVAHREAAGGHDGQAVESSAAQVHERSLLADGIVPADLETARAEVPADMCFTASALVAHAIGAMRAQPETGVLHVPRVCRGCLVDTLPHLLERAEVRVPRIEWHDEWPDGPRAQGPATGTVAGDAAAIAAGSTAGTGPQVGIVGNPLLCFDTFMNENLVDLLCSLGARPVLPDPALLFVDDARYLDQLDAFEKQGVDLVLYLQSFGCLKGHVEARGALREFAGRYPDMPMTVLDYDPESSALNRENRIRLAVSAASGKRASAEPRA